MKQRIRAAGLLIQNDHILLVKHIDEGMAYWIPPGGGFEPEDGCSKQTAKREIFEESGLTAQIGELVYVREFFEPRKDTYHIELFYWVDHWQGQLGTHNLAGLGGDENTIKAAQWVHRERIHQLKFYPEALAEDVWRLVAGCITGTAKHLGSY